MTEQGFEQALGDWTHGNSLFWLFWIVSVYGFLDTFLVKKLMKFTASVVIFIKY